MTIPAAKPPAAPAPPHVAARVRGLARVKLTEPVRLYLYSVGLVIVAGLNLAGYLTGEWQAYAISSLATLLGVVGGTEAARVSVYSTQSAVRAIRDAVAGRQTFHGTDV